MLIVVTVRSDGHFTTRVSICLVHERRGLLLSSDSILSALFEPCHNRISASVSCASISDRVTRLHALCYFAYASGFKIVRVCDREMKSY